MFSILSGCCNAEILLSKLALTTLRLRIEGHSWLSEELLHDIQIKSSNTMLEVNGMHSEVFYY